MKHLERWHETENLNVASTKSNLKLLPSRNYIKLSCFRLSLSSIFFWNGIIISKSQSIYAMKNYLSNKETLEIFTCFIPRSMCIQLLIQKKKKEKNEEEEKKISKSQSIYATKNYLSNKGTLKIFTCLVPCASNY